jgi:hypothetical protein
MNKIIRLYFLSKARECRRAYFFYRDYPPDSYGLAVGDFALSLGSFYRELAKVLS